MVAKGAERRSEEDHLHEDDGEASGKRRRVQRACDVCRKKKIRCDGLQPEKGACSNCATYGLECTFADAVKRRAPPRSYVIALEARMEKAEEVLNQLAPYLDLNKVLGPMPLLPMEKKEGDDEQDSPLLRPVTSSEEQIGCLSLPNRAANESSWNDNGYEEDEAEEAAYLRVTMSGVSLKEEEEDDEARQTGMFPRNSSSGEKEFYSLASNVSTNQASSSRRSDANKADFPLQFLGKASNFHILPLLEKMSQSGESTPLVPWSEKGIVNNVDPSPQRQQEDFSKMNFEWPELDLQEILINAYFKRPNHDMPILNEVVTRNTYRDTSWQKKDGVTLAVALGMFCVASRYVDDNRLVRLDGTFISSHWSEKLQYMIPNLFPSSGGAIVHLQATLLSIIYMSAKPKSTIAMAWVSLSFVVRMLENSGAHRKFTAKRLGYSLLKEETNKRMWWVTYVLDRQLSSDLGRPMSIQDEDFDLDEILLVDDEYIYQASENGIEPVQPAGKMCAYEGFLQAARLSQVIGRALRTIYAISKSKISRGFVGQKWDALVVADIDKALNKWLENVPSHLRYNPSETNVELLIQSSRVYMQYYNTQTLIHRPYIQREKTENNELTFKSLAIVSNAARSAIHIIHHLQKRELVASTSSEFLTRTFYFSLMLLFISWSAHMKNLQVYKSLADDVRNCLDIFKAMEAKWSEAEEMARLIKALIKRSEVPMSTPPSANRLRSKRTFEDENDTNGTNVHSHPSVPMGKSSSRDIRPIGGNLPLSTTELQTGSGIDSPDSARQDTTMSQQPSLNSHFMTSLMPSTESMTSIGSGNSYVGASADQFNATQPWQSQQPNNFSLLQLSSSHSALDRTSIDSTIFDPTNSSMDPLFSNARSQSNLQNLFGTPSALNPQFFDLSSQFQGTDGLNQADPEVANGGNSNPADPLDALVNIQSLWSDVDWMRALEYQQ